MLNNRLNTFSDEFLLLNENQRGFRKKIFNPRQHFCYTWPLCILKLKKKKLLCAFIDFEKAFDTVWRDGLWYKLLKCNIKGKMYNVILNLYNNIKSRIVYNDSVSNFIPCLNGVRQGENVYPFLFALYLNDLETFLTSKNAQGVKGISENFENDLQIYVKLFTILYADDTVLLAESAEELQSELNYFYEYCEKWNLKVNTNKSKVMVFSKGRLPINLNFKMNMELEIVIEFIYLGTMFQRTGYFKKNKIILRRRHLKLCMTF